jgi:hypothetical protein
VNTGNEVDWIYLNYLMMRTFVGGRGAGGGGVVVPWTSGCGYTYGV